MTFHAKHPDRCAGSCAEPIEVGDEVEYIDDQLVHFGCTPTAEPEPRPICPDCFLEIPLNGVCSCAS